MSIFETVTGSNGSDILIGRKKHDDLDGGPGDDRLEGGSGSDLYRFGPDFGKDVIVDTSGGVEGAAC